jgi:imidazolonepropionase
MLLIRNTKVLTLAPARTQRASADLGVIDRTDVLVMGHRVAAVGSDLTLPPDSEVIDADGRILMPAFVDCHTHLCSAGSRLDEWEQKLKGVPYLDILAAGGGIMSTVRATRQASQEDLERLLDDRLRTILRQGTTTVEIKSGYGLRTDDELKMLRAIKGAAARWPGTVIPTALLGHALDPDVPAPQFVEHTINETLPAVHAEFPRVAIDAYCEKGAWSVEDCTRLFLRAAELGHPIRVHTDQFNALGMVPAALKLGARSLDHLEAVTPDDAAAIGATGTFCVALPVCGFHLDGRYAPGRALLDAGAMLCLATNCNPGSAPSSSMPLAIALAVRHLKLTPAEAIIAATLRPAQLLALPDRGHITPNARADLLLLHHRDERSLAFEVGDHHIDYTIVAGKIATSPPALPPPLPPSMHAPPRSPGRAR